MTILDRFPHPEKQSQRCSKQQSLRQDEKAQHGQTISRDKDERQQHCEDRQEDESRNTSVGRHFLSNAFTKFSDRLIINRL